VILSHRPKRAPPAVLAGGTTMVLLGLWIAFSSSRYFGLSGAAGLPDLTVERICFALLLGYALVTFVQQRQSAGPLLPVEAGLLVFLGCCAVSALAYGGFQGAGGADTINVLSGWLLYPTLALMVVARSRLTDRAVLRLGIILTCFGIYLGVTSIAERSGLGWALVPAAIGDPSQGMHFGRARGPFLNAPIMGTVMAQLLPVAVLVREIGARPWQWLAMLAIGLLCVGVYLTDTRACLLSFLVVTLAGSLIEGPSRRLYRVLLITLTLGGIIRYAIGAVLVPRVDDTDPVDTRLNLVVASVEMILAHPLTGAGFGSFEQLSREFYTAARALSALSYQKEWADVGSHNNFLTPLAEMGLLAGGLYILLVARVAVNGLRAPQGRTAQEVGRVRGLLVCSVLVALPFLVGGLAGDFRYFLTPNALFWTFAGFTERHARLRQAPARAPIGAAGLASMSPGAGVSRTR
jgi:hypothetical protein